MNAKLIRRRLPAFCIVALALIIAACRSPTPGAATPTSAPASTTPPGESPIFSEAPVESVEIVIMESFPVQANAIVRGNLPDACTRIAQITQTREGNTFQIRITTILPTDVVCAQVLTPFEETITLNVAGLPAGEYTVVANGVSAAFTLTADNSAPTLATPVADSPAAGICASFDGEVVEAQIYPDIPDPRCVKIKATQKLALFNRTSTAIEITLGPFNARIEPEQTYTIDRPFGDYLAPGVHRVLAPPYSGPELWLEGDEPATPDPSRYYNDEAGFSLQLPEGWQVLGPLTVNNDPARPYTLYMLGLDPAPGGPGNSQIVIADAAQWTPEQFAQAQCSACPANPFETVTLGGQPARRTLVGGGGVPFTITWYFVEHSGKLIALAIHDPETLAPLENVIESINFH